MDQGSTMKRSAVHNFAPTVTKFCVMWEGQALPHDTKFGNSRCEIVGRRVIFIWSLIHGLRWSGLIKAEPGYHMADHRQWSKKIHLGYIGSFRCIFRSSVIYANLLPSNGIIMSPSREMVIPVFIVMTSEYRWLSTVIVHEFLQNR